LTSYTVFNERRNYTPVPYTVTRNKLNAITGDINIEGSRAVDNAKFVVTSPVDVKIGDIVSCIADDVDTDELIGAWNFYHNLRDESGYNFDGVDSSNNIVYTRDTAESSRFRGHPYIDFSASNPTITITPSTTENNSTIINFDSNSSIILWCRVPSLSNGESQIIFDRSDSGNGLKIGVQNSGGTYYAFIQVKGSGGSWATSSLNANVETSSGKDIMIGVEKFSSNQYRVSVNASYWNYAVYAGDIEDSSPPPIRLGLSSAGSNRFDGRLYSLRMYTKTLSSTDYTTMFKRKQPFSTMKFAGKVTKVDDGNSATKIEAVGFSSELLLKTEMTKSFSSHLRNDGAYKYDSSSGEDTLLENIISNIISVVNSNVLDSDDIKYEFVYDNVGDEDDIGGSEAWKTKSNKFHMRNINVLDVSGRLHSLTQILSILGGKEYNSSGNLIHNNGADSFFMLPRKVLVYESSDIDNNTHFSIGDYNILDGGYSSNSIYNDVSIFGKGDLKYSNFYITGISNHPVTNSYDLGSNLGEYKQFMGITQSDGFDGSTYKKALRYNSPLAVDTWNYDNVTETFHYKVSDTDIDSIYVTVAYLDLTNNSAALTSEPSTVEKTYYYQIQNDASIEKYGKRPKKFFYPMLEDMTTTAAVCRRILGSNAEKQRKAQIIIPHLSNSVQIGSKVIISNDLKNISNDELTVKSINYSFPKFKTTVNVGDYSYDFLDNIGQLLDTVNSQESQRSGVT